jgi:hypothetical protein
MILTLYSVWYIEAGSEDIRVQIAETMRDMLIDGLQMSFRLQLYN